MTMIERIALTEALEYIERLMHRIADRDSEPMLLRAAAKVREAHDEVESA
jgi:hypothetical protein